MKTVVDVKNITKRYGTNEVLKNVSLTCEIRKNLWINWPKRLRENGPSQMYLRIGYSNQRRSSCVGAKHREGH